jgi:hypothetical protein
MTGEGTPTTVTEITIDMAIPNESGGVQIRPTFVLARLFILAVGLGAITWGGLVLPVFRQQAPVNRVASELLKGRSFKLDTLVTEVQKASQPLSNFCNPSELRSFVVLRRAILNDIARSGQVSPSNSAATALDGSTRSAVACSPADSFAWLTMFWLDAAKHGLTPENERYLRMSYARGPNEGWIAYWRVQLALAEFANLPEDLSEDALEDFVKLINTQVLYQEAAEIFLRAPTSARSRIIDSLRNTDARPREAFAKLLSDRGLDVSIPGTDLPESRPWRK